MTVYYLVSCLHAEQTEVCRRCQGVKELLSQAAQSCKDQVQSLFLILFTIMLGTRNYCSLSQKNYRFTPVLMVNADKCKACRLSYVSKV